MLDLTICLKFQAPTTQKNIKQKVLKFMCPLLNIPSVFLPKLFPLQNKEDETLVKVIEKGDLANEFLGPLQKAHSWDHCHHARTEICACRFVMACVMAHLLGMRIFVHHGGFVLIRASQSNSC